MAVAVSPAKMPNATSAPTIYVVEDDRGTREAMQILLTGAGDPVKTYASAAPFPDSFQPGKERCH